MLFFSIWQKDDVLVKERKIPLLHSPYYSFDLSSPFNIEVKEKNKRLEGEDKLITEASYQMRLVRLSYCILSP